MTGNAALLPAIFALLLLLCAALAPAAVVDESDSEFFASVDADGDGRVDQVIVDRPTGAIRLGYQTAAETVTWSAARITGLDEITGVGAARFFAQNRVAFALANPAANRVVLIDPTNPTAPFTPTIRYPAARGPAALAGLAKTLPSVDHIFIGARFGDSPLQPDTLSVMKPDGTSATTVPLAIDGRVERANPIFLRAGFPEGVATMIRLASGNSEFRVYDPAAGNQPALLASVAGFAGTSAWVSDFFNSASFFAQALFYTPGSPDLRVRTVTQPGANYVFGPESLYTFSAPISQVFVVPDPAGTRLLIVFQDGALAAIFTFNGTSAPVEVLTMVAPPGQRFSGASALGGGHFSLLSGPASQRRSSGFHQYRRAAGGTYSEVASGGLPVVGNHTGRGNVFVFGLEPFVSSNAGIKSVLLAPDWSSQFSFFNGTVRATQEAFLGGASGLANPTTASLGATPAGGAFGMVNQVRADAAIMAFRAPYALDTGDVTIDPPAGYYPNAITVTLTSRDPAKVIRYRLGPTQPWQYSFAPFSIALDTTVEFNSENLTTGVRTPIRSASYTFASGGVGSDRDGDGVPDFVEVGCGLDPSRGRDSDGDGYSDLEEILAGTNPNNATSHPSTPPTTVFKQGFDLTVTPVIYAFFNPQPQSKSPLLDITARDLSGLTIAVEKTGAATFFGPPPVAQFFGFRAPVGPFFALGTPSFFTVAVPPPPQSGFVFLAAERVGLVLPPNATAPGILYTPQGGTLAQEAAAWKAAALAAVQNPPAVAATLSPLDTLSGLIVERKLRDILAGRAITDAALANLFPYRSAANALHAIAPELLAELGTRDQAGHPAYDLRAVRTTIEDSVKNNAAQTHADLRRLAVDLYQTFEYGLPENAHPGATALTVQPVDAIRLFLNGQPLPADYLAITTLTAAERASALQGLTAILAAAAPRPIATFTLELRADTFRDGCTVMHDVPGNRDVALYDDTLHPWRFFGSITPPPGTRASVVAYSDLPAPPPGCGVASLGVISLTITTFPPDALTDADGDGLPDAWENALLGSLDQTGLDDPDGDGMTNVAELLAGTDPRDECSIPFVPFVPVLNIAREQPGGGIRLFWDYPVELVAGVIFSLESNPEILNFADWLPFSATITNPQPGHFQAILPPASPPKRFYRLRVTAQ